MSNALKPGDIFFDAAWDVRMTDTSLRDGSHHKRHQFTGDEVRAIVEQSDGDLFNYGALKNIGFLLGEAGSTYCCLHDVDHLPIWADYSEGAHPSRLVWFG